MQGMMNDGIRLAHLHNVAQIHHRHPRRYVADDGNVVADEQDAGIVVFHQLQQHVDDVSTHGHIQHGHRLVRHDERWVQQHGPEDGDALQLAAGKLVRVAGDVVLRRPQPRPFQDIQADAVLRLGRAADFVQLQWRHQNLADRVAGIKDIVRVLEDQLDLSPKGQTIAAPDAFGIDAVDGDSTRGG